MYALRVLSSVLQQGDSSRLYQTLNKEKELVIGIGGFVDERIGPGGLYIGATVRPGKKAEDVEAAIYEEIERLQQQPIAEWELREGQEHDALRLSAEHSQRAVARNPARHATR